MDANEYWEIKKKIGQPCDAIAAHIVSGDEGLARELAESLTHDELIILVLWLARLYAFASVDSLQRAGDMEAEEARRRTVEHFRRFAALNSLDFGDLP